MYLLNQKPSFARKLKKLLKKDKALTKPIGRTLTLLKTNPKAAPLKSHKVIAVDGNQAFSSRVTSDLRIIWRYSTEAAEQVQILDLIDVGGHEGSKKVYQ